MWIFPLCCYIFYTQIYKTSGKLQTRQKTANLSIISDIIIISSVIKIEMILFSAMISLIIICSTNQTESHV